jgi:RecB family endonuclease NucS
MGVASVLAGLLRRPEARAAAEALHADAVKGLEEQLRTQGWRVESDPLIGTARPDVVATNPSGIPYVFEVKRGAAQLSAIAQVESYRDLLRQQRGPNAKGVLLVDADPPPELSDIARSADIELAPLDPDAPKARVSLDTAPAA